jgi:DNA-binding NtrC family response regulator
VLSGDTPVVLVVDDDVSVRESLELLIFSAGWQPETFASAEEFLDRSAVDGPCCLVLDVRLPNLNGLDLQKRIIDRADVPIIFITGYGDVPTTVEAMKAGAYTAWVGGDSIGNVVLVTRNAAGQAQHIVANYRLRSTLLQLSRLIGDHFSGTPICEHFATSSD